MEPRESDDVFWVYENGDAGPPRALIHRSSCRQCMQGRGRKDTSDTARWRWLGPYTSIEAADRAAQQTGADVTPCKICRPR